MICLHCSNRQTQPDKVVLSIRRRNTTVIVKSVPADVCEQCGEFYLADDVTARVAEKAEAAAKSGAVLEILSFAA